VRVSRIDAAVDRGFERVEARTQGYAPGPQAFSVESRS
jgi:hypothetical protein